MALLKATASSFVPNPLTYLTVILQSPTMASESGDPFDGASPPAFSPNNGQDFEENLLPIEDSDLPMPDTFALLDVPSPEIENAATTKPKVPKPSLRAMQDELAANPTILRNNNFIPTKKDDAANRGEGDFTAQQGDGDVDLIHSEKVDRIKGLLSKNAGKDETNAAESQKSKSPELFTDPRKSAGVIIKREVVDCEMMDNFIPAECIDLSDTDGELQAVKQERVDGPFDWMHMDDDTISISDSDDDDGIEFITLDDGTEQPLKQEDPDVEFVWSSMGDQVIDLDADEELPRARAPNFGRSILGRNKPRAQRTPADIAKILQRQRVFADMSLRKAGKPGPARGDPNAHPHKRPNIGDDDDDSWMSSDYNPEENAAIKFRELKRSYKAKKKAGTNTMDDDIEIAKARKIEEARLNRLEREYLNSRGLASDDDSSGEEEETLFVAQSPPRGTKRRRARNMADDDGIDNREAPQKRRQNQRRTGKAEQAAIDLDLEMSMQAGIEGYFRKNLEAMSKAEDAGAKKGRQAGQKSGKGVKNKKAPRNLGEKGKAVWSKELQKGKLKPRKKKPTEIGYLNNSGSLLTGNVFEYAEANNSLAPLPFTTERNKHASLAAMVEGLPKGHKFRSEKEHIRRSTIALGNKKVVPDGKGGWSIPQMISSLRHHQVQGSAWMKDRELQSDEPLGGILADGKLCWCIPTRTESLESEVLPRIAHLSLQGQIADSRNSSGMGLGKTIQTLCLMISNPPTRDDRYKATLIVCTPPLVSQCKSICLCSP